MDIIGTRETSEGFYTLVRGAYGIVVLFKRTSNLLHRYVLKYGQNPYKVKTIDDALKCAWDETGC